MSRSQRRFQRLIARYLRHLRSRGYDDAGPLAAADATLRRRVLSSAPLLERILLENILPFWYPRVIDQDHGGYHLHHDPAGDDLGPLPKGLMAQTRTLWFFSRMVRAGYRAPEMREAARHGYDFLTSRFLDHDRGGFYWEVSHDGSSPTDTTKFQYGQAFAIYALAEYALACGDREAAEIAEATCAAVERHLRDDERGGYWERLDGNWDPGSLPPELTRSPSGGKHLGSMLHLLEAYAMQASVRPDSVAARLLPELLLICSSSVVRKRFGVTTDVHRSDWSPRLEGDGARVSYGHDLETIHLVIAACESADIPPMVLADLHRTLLDYCLRFGHDHQNGGFYFSGWMGRRADRRDKVWWVQAEGLLASIEAFRVTREAIPAQTYLTTLDWIASRQVDWERGGWHAFVPVSGPPYGRKADMWKGAYHSGRSIIHAIEAVATLRGQPEGETIK